jgi:hypothetical protein
MALIGCAMSHEQRIASTRARSALLAVGLDDARLKLAAEVLPCELRLPKLDYRHRGGDEWGGGS